jgi:hypothetical protein
MTILRPDPSGTVRVASEVEAGEFVRLFVERVASAPRGKR